MADTVGTISVIIPARNRRHLLAAALESVESQTLPAHEVIVVDQESDDGTAEFLHNRGIQWFSDSRRGAGYARQLGLEHSQGEFVLFLDSDDWLVPSALEVLSSGLGGSLHMTYGKYRVEDLRGSSNQDGSLVGPAPTPTTCLIRRAAFEEFGGFDGDNFSFPRWVIQRRVAGLRGEAIDEVVAHRRIHDSNVSVQPGSSKGLLDLIRTHRTLMEKRG